MGINIIILTLIISSALSFILAYYIWRRRKILGTPSLGGILISISIWTFFSALEHIASTHEQKMFFTIICYFGIVQVPVWFFLFAVEYTSGFGKISLFQRILLWVVPVLSFIILVTNGSHSLFFSSSALETAGTIAYHKVEFGFWWWIHTAYSYLLILAAILLLFRMLLSSSPQQRGQIWIILISCSIPFLSNIIYVSGLQPYGFVDLTPVAFASTGILFFYGMFSKKLFTVKPIALDTLFANLPDGIIVLDKSNGIVDINPSACSMLGINNQNLLGQPLNSALPNYNQLLSLGSITSQEILFNDKSIDISQSPMVNNYGQIIGTLLIFRDITDRKIAESELKSTRDRFELAIMAAGLDPWENNLVTGKRIGGQKLFNDLGYSMNEIPSTLHELFTLVHPDDIKQVKQSINNHLVGKTELYTSDFRVLDKSGNYQWVANFGKIVERDRNEKATRFIGLTLNINESKKSEEKIRRQNEALLKANAEKDKFFSIIAHDLKGPFQGFMGLTEIMAESITHMSQDEIRDVSQTLQGTAKNLYELLDNLLNWAMVKRGHKKFDVEKIRLKAIAISAIDLIKHQSEHKEQTIINEIEESVEVLADRETLKTVLRNLVSNAVKFTPRNGTIKLAAKLMHNGFVEVSIQDTGIGMPSEIVDNLFKLSQKVSRPGTEKEPSTGLGLILCKEFIEKHGGKIWVESKPDLGSTFFFTIPTSS